MAAYDTWCINPKKCSHSRKVARTCAHAEANLTRLDKGQGQKRREIKWIWSQQMKETDTRTHGEHNKLQTREKEKVEVNRRHNRA